MASQGKEIENWTIKELFSQSSGGTIPILIDIQHDKIIWHDNFPEQENGHLRLINDTVPVKYNGHRYIPAVFNFKLPTEDGKKVGNTTVAISALDQRIIEIIRSIDDKPPIAIFEAFFAKRGTGQDINFVFSKIYQYKFSMNSASWNDVSAEWNLTFDDVMGYNVPKDLGTQLRCPAVNE